MTVRVLLFGPEASKAGRDHVIVQLVADRTCGAVKAAVTRSCEPIAESVGAARIALNGKFADDEQIVSDGDEVAVIGMVSGG